MKITARLLGVVGIGVSALACASPSPGIGAEPGAPAATPSTPLLSETITEERASTPSLSCVNARFEAKPVRVELAFVFDKSFSMAFGGRFTSCSRALKQFFGDARSQGLSASLLFFPLATFDCRQELYAAPQVSMRPLPDDNSFRDVLDTEAPDTLGTPALPALNAAYAYLDSLQGAGNGPSRPAVVLVTDGVPLGCGSSLGTVGDAARNVAARIPTYVLGLGSDEGLDAIAAAGGTGKAIRVSTVDPGAVTDGVLGALDALKKSAGGCEFELPSAPDGRELNLGTVNVAVQGSGELMSYDKDCKKGGWHYDNPEAPRRIALCADTCRGLAAASKQVELHIGCTTQGTDGSIPK